MTVTKFSVKLFKLLSSDPRPTIPEAKDGDRLLEIDTGDIYENQANGWTKIITADRLKTGSVVVQEGSYEDIIFGSGFVVPPKVVASVVSEDPSGVALTISNITINGFRVHLVSSETEETIHWMAAAVGNL